MSKSKTFKISCLFSFLLLLLSCQKEEPIVDVCNTNRYRDLIFTETVKSTNVQYHSALGTNGNVQGLFMDIHQPKGDDNTEARPLIIWVHGGHFIGGSKEELDGLALTSALRGFVSSTISYRLLNIFSGVPDTSALYDVVAKSTHDIRNAVQFFIADARGQNTYRIDTNQIYLGGVSAGSIAVIHTAYLDAGDNIPASIAAGFAKNGGFDGAPNVRKYIKGVINLSGAILNPDIMDADEPALYSFHGSDDATVPIGQGFVGAENLKLVEMFGSKIMHEKAKSIGLSSLFVEVKGGGHTNIYLESQFAEARSAFDFNTFSEIKAQICNQ